MNKINRIFTMFLFLVFAGAAASGISAYFNSFVDLGISDMERKIFDLQVKLRSLTTGELISGIRGWEEKKLKESFDRLAPPAISYAFGVDYLSTFLSSSGNVSFSNVQDAKFPDISLVGLSVKKGVAALTVNIQGEVQMWIFKYEDGWKTKDVPFGYFVEDLSLSRDRVSFSLSAAGQKRKYEFPIAAVPGQYAAP